MSKFGGQSPVVVIVSYWAKTYGPGKAKAVALDKNGDIIVAGEREGNAFVARLEGDGKVKWFKTYGGRKYDGANAVALAQNGDIIVAGYTDSFGTGGYNFWVLRLDADGNVKWQKTYGGEYSDGANAVVVADNGGIIVAGYSQSFGAGGGVWVLRLDANGNVKWQKTYGGSDDDEANAVAIDDNGDVVVAGYTRSFGSSGYNFWVLRLDANGNVKWQKTYGGRRDDKAYAVALAQNGDVIVVGYTKSFGAGGADAWVLRLDANGNVKWQKTYGGSDWDEAHAVALAPNGDIIVAGYSQSFGAGGGVWVLRLPPDGNLPGCNFCKDSNARVMKTNAKVHNTHCEVLSGVGRYIVLNSNASMNLITPSIQTQCYTKSEEVRRMEGQLLSAITLSMPSMTEGIEVPLKLTLTNDLADSLEVILDLSGNNFLKLGKTKLKFPELKKGQKASRTIKIQPLKPGNFNLKIKIKAIVNGVTLETEKTIPVKVERLNIEEILHVAVPQLVESIEAPLKLTLTNNLADSLKVTLDLSGNEFFELEEEIIEFPELRKGQEIAKTVMVKPKYAGNFDFRVKIKALVNGIELEAEKVIPVEVAERAATPQTSVTPTTPVMPSPATPVTPSASYQAVTSFPAELTSVYEPIEELGRGGFARVFKAKRKSDGEIVAVKIPLSLDPVTGKSFLKEIENWTKLKHPNIVRVYDYNILPVPFFEMEYCESSLERVPTPMKAKEAALLVFNIAEGLKYAHSKGIIHRDLKPSNILLKSGIPKISDWGLSKVLGQSGTTTTSFTALYAAPEQFSRSKFGPTDERTDIWQLGVIFYQLVTGKLPFESEDPFELMFLIMNEEPAKPSELNPEAGEVEHIILRMLAKEKAERYENVAELQQDLASYLGIEFRRELKRSRTMGDRRLIVYYLGNLLIMSVKMGNLSGAYKYASDFTMLTDGELRREFEALSEQFRLRLEERLEVPVELIEKTDILVHKAMVRVR